MTDFESLQKTAYGFLGLKPWEFWRLTPKQFYLMLEGYRERDEVEYRKSVQNTAWIMNALGSKVTVNDLLKPSPTKQDAEDAQEAFNQAPDRR